MAIAGQIFDFRLNDTSTVGFLNKINSFTDVGQGGVIGIEILLIIGGALFLMMKGYSRLTMTASMATSMLITATIGIFLRLMGLINDTVLTICIIILVLSIFMLMRESAPYEQ